MDAIDRPDPFEQVFDPYIILEVLGRIFVDEVSIIEPQKTDIYGIFWAFICVLYKTLMEGSEKPFIGYFDDQFHNL